MEMRGTVKTEYEDMDAEGIRNSIVELKFVLLEINYGR
jgi:hypothetical protein